MEKALIGLVLVIALCPRINGHVLGGVVGRSELEFEPNHGQAPALARFVGHARQYRVWLGADGSASFTLVRQSGERGPFFKMTPRGSRPVSGAGLGRAPAVTHYYGRPDVASIPGIPRFQRVRFARIYAGIDLVYQGGPAGVEYEFHLAPGADPRQIRLQLSCGRAWLERSGDLLLRSGGALLRQRQPLAYQEEDSGRESGSVRFVLTGSTVSLQLGAYDRSRTTPFRGARTGVGPAMTGYGGWRSTAAAEC